MDRYQVESPFDISGGEKGVLACYADEVAGRPHVSIRDRGEVLRDRVIDAAAGGPAEVMDATEFDEAVGFDFDDGAQGGYAGVWEREVIRRGRAQQGVIREAGIDVSRHVVGLV